MNKKEKLLLRPVDSETRILNTSLVQFKEFVALMERWSWDGFTGQSVVLLSEDYKLQAPSQVLVDLFSQMRIPQDPKTTVKEIGEYVFINFDFSVD